MDDAVGTAVGEPAQLEVCGGGRTWRTTANRVWTVGRSSEVDIRLENPRISRVHAILEPTAAGWVLINRSSNGMFCEGQRVERLTISHPVSVLLGSVTSGQILELQPVRTAAPDSPQSPTPIGEATTSVVALPVQQAKTTELPITPAKTTEMPVPQAKTAEITVPPSKTTEIPIPPPAVTGASSSVGQTSVTRAPTAVHAIDAVVVSIGRAPENTVVLNDLLVSRRHALLRRSGTQWELLDNHSANGTYVNGTRITRAIIGPQDIVGIGHQLLHLSGERLVEYVDTGDISYEAANVRVQTKDKVLLDDINFVLPQRSLLAVVG
ncbi:MAG: transport system ATP-binding/permease protein, partial [Pseudonocardiales bacterium]|nr:transport system ATP-binding/permease protein [Pseudonocardiales bacterium]